MKTLKDMYINHDHSIYATVAESIHRLQCVFGKVHNIYGKGKAAKAVFDILKLKERKLSISQMRSKLMRIMGISRVSLFLTGISTY